MFCKEGMVTMEPTPEAIANDVITLLQQGLAQQEDAEAAIAVYKLCNWLIGELDRVKRDALALAEQDLAAKGQAALRTPAGSAGWTEPEIKQLDETAWLHALAQNPALMERQRVFDLAQAALQQAQMPYLKLPPSRFFIR